MEFVRFNDVADLEAKFDDSVCAIVLEAIQGEGGIFPLSGAFWARARELASQSRRRVDCGRNTVRAGPYRPAICLSAIYGAPDIVVVAKALAGGLPLGAILARESFAEAFAPGLHGSTFGGGPLACATALEFLNTVEDENLLENVRDRGAQLRAGPGRLAAQLDLW